MHYIEVKIYTTKEGIDPLTCILMDMGIAGFVIEDADDFREFLNKKNSYDWDYVDEGVMRMAEVETNLTFYLDATEESHALLDDLRIKLDGMKHLSGSLPEPGYGRLAVVTKVVDDGEWKDNWKAYFKPSRITDRITIKPTWEDYQGEKEELIIEIDPGMAFGTGTHPTTSLCVKLLEEYLVSETDTVLDVGCGSGILSIAAALLGAREVKAVEIDPVAVEVGRENVALNGFTDQIEVFEGDLTKGLNYQADIVVANLMADLVILLSKDVSKHLKEKGIYISSGILTEKRDLVADAIQKCGFQILEIREQGEWCAIAAEKRHSS